MARGLGSRMRKHTEGVSLDPEQAAAADAGVKAMISVGRPFLDHVISAIADAGFSEICLVIGPEHSMIRDYYDQVAKKRTSITYAIQAEPLGTADAVSAAREFAGDDHVLVINSDNYYPSEVVAKLASARGSATLGFEPAALIANSNIPAERVGAFALLESDEAGNLRTIIEKPSAEQVAALGDRARVSMNCWLLSPAVMAHTCTVEKSPRGEYELVDAVRAAVDEGEHLEVFEVAAGVLDLSSKTDIASVVDALSDKECRL